MLQRRQPGAERSVRPAHPYHDDRCSMLRMPSTGRRVHLASARAVNIRLKTVTMPPLHWGQAEVLHDGHRFKVLACGRRWGKTRMCAALCVAEAIRGKRVWWVAPSYGQAKVGWRELTNLAVQVPSVDIRGGDLAIAFPGGGYVQVRSAAGQTGLRGEGLDGLVIDECAFIAEKAWTEALRPTLSDRKGWALLISTPKGRNWWWKAWLRGQDPLEREWRSWRFPTSSNPFIDPEEIEEARRNLPELSFRQEYLAEFIEDAGLVFRKVMLAATAEEQPDPVPAGHYVMGVDWAKYQDYTVLTVMERTARKMVCLDRFNQVDYRLQKARLVALARKWNVERIKAERNSIGEPLIEELLHDRLPVDPFTTTNASKKELVDALALAFEREEIRILPDPVLVGELQAYEMEKTPSGLLRYKGPEGYHDDCVISLGLANLACIEGAPAELSEVPWL